MRVTVHPSPIGGSVAAPASKSQAHRLLICAALSKDRSEIVCPEVSDDILATVSCLNALGADIRREGDVFCVSPIVSPPETADIDCGESGSTLRFLLPVISALGVKCRVTMHGRLPQRPLSPLYELLTEHGAVLSGLGKTPLHISGKLRGGAFSIAGDVSSQFISGLLFALPLIGGKVNITSKLESAPYLDMSCRCLETAGVAVHRTGATISVSGGYGMSGRHTVEGDWSNAAFWLCAGAIGAKPVTVTGLDMRSAQGDRQIVELLRRLGAKVDIAQGAVTVFPSKLKACDIDAGDIPDLVPVISLLCAAADGESRIYNAARLRLKESDRLAAISALLGAMGCALTQTDDGLIIRGGRLHGAELSSFGDHRIAMTTAVASLLCDGDILIDGAEAVRKSYPRFFDDFAALGGRLELT